MYAYALSMISAGVRIICKIPLQAATVTTVITTAKTMESHTLFATYFRSPVSSFAPNFCATGMAKPLHTPMQKPMIKKLMEPVEPTAARAFTPRYFPTMMVSTIL